MFTQNFNKVDSEYSQPYLKIQCDTNSTFITFKQDLKFRERLCLIHIERLHKLPYKGLCMMVQPTEILLARACILEVYIFSGAY